MKTRALTIRLDAALERQLRQLARRTGRSRSDVARDALRRQLAIAQFDDLRRRVMPLAEARGYLTDEDVFRDVS
ncbi:MAG TPA: ribbon-helix-helix protein, CopG family [Gemmatimonadaceae bacterium]|nr:ribbon-helix-helix protein, CopG family [Gemmatimonadaceae bacterium]